MNKIRKLITFFKIRFSRKWKITHYEFYTDDREPKVVISGSKE